MTDVVRVILAPGQRLEVTYSEPDVTVEAEALPLHLIAQRFSSTPKQLRAAIASGRLPATKVGRGYLVRVDDAEAFFRPQLAESTPDKPRPRSADERAREQLRAAGVRIGGSR